MQLLNDLKLFPAWRRFSDDEKPFLCLDTTPNTISPGPRLDDDRRRGFGVCPTVQPRPFQVTSLAQHRSLSRRPDPRRRRCAFTTECVLYRSSERRRLED